MKRVLVTGSSGFIGSHLVERLRSMRVDVFEVDLKTGSDINDVKTLPKHHFDVVFHLGAYVSASKSVEEPIKCYKTNVGGSLNLIEKYYDSRFVFASTSAVYGEALMLRDGYSENDYDCIDMLRSPYAKSKLTVEEIIKDSLDSYGILRFFNVYGEGQNPEYGAVIQAFTDESKKDDPSYTIYGDGSKTRDFIHVDDVVDALITTALSDKNFVSNVGTGVETSVSDLQKMISNGHGEVSFKEDRAGDPKKSYMYIPSFLEKEEGWIANIELEEGLDDF